MRLVQRRWLEVHPPRYLDQPYHIELILSYSDTRYHRGTVYRATNFQYAGQTIGRPRHHNKSRGPGTDGAVLLRFVYRLMPPRWAHHPGAGLPLFGHQHAHGRTRHIPA